VTIRVAEQDFLDEIISERSAANPDFPAMVQRALEHRDLMRALAVTRESMGISQTLLAARMNTSQSSVARMEAGDCDVRLSTLERYAAALGKKIQWDLRDLEPIRRSSRRRSRRVAT
jgi:ribosome-binding protein aMBF1 (putative translation factor)